MIKEITNVSFREYLPQTLDNNLYEGLVILQSLKSDFTDSIAEKPVRFNKLGVCLIRRGTVQVNLNFTTVTLNANSLFFLSPMTVLEILSYSDDIEMYTLFTDFALFNKIGIPIYQTYSMEGIGENRSKILAISAQQASRFYEYMANLEQQNKKVTDKIYQHEIIKMTLMLFFYEINAEVNQKLLKNTIEGYTQKNKTVMDFLQLVTTHFKTERGIHFYAEQLCISRKYLSRIVKEVTGSSPKNIVDGIIISEAIILLSVSTMTVKDVMFALNFIDMSTFSKFFKAHVGQSPISYKNKLAKA